MVFITNQAERLLSDQTACLVVQHPNYFGCLEDVAALADAAHRRGALLIAFVDAISLGLLAPPGASDADIAVGEFLLARALGPITGERPRARELARRALERLALGVLERELDRALGHRQRPRAVALQPVAQRHPGDGVVEVLGLDDNSTRSEWAR